MSTEALEQPRQAAPRAEHAHGMWLALIVVVGGVLRFYQLGAQSLWHDELASVELASNPPSLLWSDWMVRETNPPLYYTLLHYWMRAFGDSEAAVRFPSALLGSAVPPLIYVLGRRIASARVGLIAATIAALSALQLQYSQETRSYMLAILATLVTILALCQLADRLIDPRPPRGRFAEASPWVLYVVGCSVALYSHTTLVLLPLLANVYFVWLWAARSPRESGVAVRWGIANAVCLLLWLWWGSLTLRQMALPQPNYSWIHRLPLGESLLITAYVYIPGHLGLASYLVGPVLLAIAALGLRRLRRDRAVLLAVFGLGAPLLIILISQRVPILLPRTLLWAQFAVILAMATSLAAIPGRLQAGVLALLFAVQSVDSIIARQEKEPWREVISALQRHMGPREVLLFSSEAIGAHIQHYCREPECQIRALRLLVPGEDLNRWAEGFSRAPQVRPDELPSVLARYDRVYTLGRWTDDPQSYVQPLADEESPDGLGLPPNSPLPVRVWRARSAGKVAQP
ncbi:glycosyltransferase family 39 protein [Archangium sp.]|uniref:glycosyltransferase family 39 protein n=1 Tax=Archangium sp. TaxID=1872627 RepID=UPI002D278C24|nr:glycosyltransferase family 39 protein [Archangium sp.]HYO51357.1 glycosyltransferase family 39 protein [Archangium sp.]